MPAKMMITPVSRRFTLCAVAVLIASAVAASASESSLLFRFAVLTDVTCSDDVVITTLNAADFKCDRITVSEATNDKARNDNLDAEAKNNGVRALLAASAVGIDECVVERAVSACAVLDEAATGQCGGFVVETSVRAREVRVHLISAAQLTAGLPLISSEGSTFFEKRNVVSGSAAAAAERITHSLDEHRAQHGDMETSSEDDAGDSMGDETMSLEMLVLDDEDELQAYMNQILEESEDEELERLRMELVAFASAQQQQESRAQEEGAYGTDGVVSVDTDTIAAREAEMLKELASKQEDVLEEALEKAGFFPKKKKKKKPVVVCKAGRLIGGGFEKGSLILGTPPVYQPGFCKRPQIIPRRCQCTEPIVIPGFCVDGIFTPGKPNQYVPPTFSPKQYVPGRCSLFYKAIGHPSP